MLDYFEPGHLLSWRGPDQIFSYKIYTNEQEELLLKRKGFTPTPLEAIAIASASQMYILCHGAKPRLCRNIVGIEASGFPVGFTTLAPDFPTGVLRPLYVIGRSDKLVQGLGRRAVLSLVLGDEEDIRYEFDLQTGLMVWTNNWQIEPGLPKTCEVLLEEADLAISQLDYQSRPVQFKQYDEKQQTRPPIGPLLRQASQTTGGSGLLFEENNSSSRESDVYSLDNGTGKINISEQTLDSPKQEVMNERIDELSSMVEKLQNRLPKKKETTISRVFPFRRRRL